MVAKRFSEPIYINVKCVYCGMTTKTDKHEGKIRCENDKCQKEINIEEGFNFAKGDWG